jgi:hypothetical protein
MAGSKIGVATVLSLLLAAAGVLAPIAWDRYQRRSSLELRKFASSIVVSPTQVVEKLTIEYDGQPVPSVARADFMLFNSGRTAIRREDVVTPVTLRVTRGHILDLRISRMMPENVGASLAIDERKQAVVIEFPLLNPGDGVHFSMLVSATSVDADASTRIVGITGLDVVDIPTAPESPWRRLPWTLYLAAAGTLLCTFIALGMLHLHGQESQIAELSRRGAIAVPTGTDPAMYRVFIDGVLRNIKANELKPLQAALAVQGEKPLTAEQAKHFQTLLDAGLRTTTGVTGAFWFMTVIAVFGLLYVARGVLAVIRIPGA